MLKYKQHDEFKDLKDMVETMKNVLIKMDARLNRMEIEIKYIKKYISNELSDL